MTKMLIVVLTFCTFAVANPALANSVRIVTPSPGHSLGFSNGPNTSSIRENCQYGNDGITRCDDCDVDWDQSPPAKLCIVAALCYDNNGKPIKCP